MSGRSRKATAVKSSTETTSVKKTSTSVPKTRVPSTPAHSSPSPVRERSMSPLSISRQDEKDELAYLNDRLAGYIDYVRQLEKDKSRLTKRIQSVTEEQLDKSDAVRKTYDKEISTLRALVDDLAGKRAQLELEAQTAREQCKEAKTLAQKLEHENSAMEKKLDSLEKELAACRQDPDKYNKLKKEHEALRKKSDAMRKEIDEQVLARTDLENRVTSLKEELDFQKRLWVEERQTLVTKTSYIEEEIDTRKAAEYESRLADELRELRNQTAEELEAYKLEMETAFEFKLNQLKASSADQNGETAKVREEMQTLRRRFDEVSRELAQKTSEADLYRRRCNDLDKQLSEERDDFAEQIKTLKDEIDRLNEEIQNRVKEFTDLLHAKVCLDQEILVYRKMLEGEESRLNIPTPPRSSSFCMRAGKKRRLDLEDGLDETALGGQSFLGSRMKAQFAYQVTSNAVGDLEFDGEQNGKGKWVRLINKSSKSESVDVGNWILTHSADGHEIQYKFPVHTVIKKGSTCTIWSKDAGADNNPPADIVMDTENFAAGTNISIRLVDAKGEEQASCSVTKERITRTGRLSSMYRAGGPSDEKCSLM